jgi:hypothetical protein
MLRHWSWLKALLLVGIGAALTVGIGQWNKVTFPSHSFSDKESTKIILSDEATNKCENGWYEPDLRCFAKRAKFVNRVSYEAPLHYQVELEMPNADVMKRGREEAEQITAQLSMFRNRPQSRTETTYPQWALVRMHFVLRDKDGFKLAELKGSDVHTLQGGQNVSIEGQTLEGVSADTARETTSVTFKIELVDIGNNQND